MSQLEKSCFFPTDVDIEIAHESDIKYQALDRRSIVRTNRKDRRILKEECTVLMTAARGAKDKLGPISLKKRSS